MKSDEHCVTETEPSTQFCKLQCKYETFMNRCIIWNLFLHEKQSEHTELKNRWSSWASENRRVFMRYWVCIALSLGSFCGVCLSLNVQNSVLPYYSYKSCSMHCVLCAFLTFYFCHSTVKFIIPQCNAFNLTFLDTNRRQYNLFSFFDQLFYYWDITQHWINKAKQHKIKN